MKPHFSINCFKQLKKIIQFCFIKERSAIINTISFVTIALVLVVSSCTIPSNNEVPLLKAENILLKARNDSLLAIINTLTTSPEKIIIEAKSFIAINKPDSALILLNALYSKIPDTKTIATLNKLKKQLTSKQKTAKKKVYTNASNHNVLNKKATKTVTTNSNKLTTKQETNAWTTNKKSPLYKPVSYKKVYKVRVGAICADGSRSYATGRGACSHHGGVSEWLYE